MNSGLTVHPGLGVSVQARDGVTVAELDGELDTASAPALREQLLGLLRPGSSRLVIDLSQVSFCDASGLAVLVGAGRRATLLGGFVRLAAISPQASQVLQATGLHRHLASFPTVRAAAASPPGAQLGRTGAAAAGTQPGGACLGPGGGSASRPRFPGDSVTRWPSRSPGRRVA